MKQSLIIVDPLRSPKWEPLQLEELFVRVADKDSCRKGIQIKNKNFNTSSLHPIFTFHILKFPPSQAKQTKSSER